MSSRLPIRAAASEHVGLDELADRCGLHPDLVRRFVVLGLVEELAPGLFHVEVGLRLQRIVRLRQDLGVNYAGIGLVLDLLDRIDVLEARLRDLGMTLTE